MPTRLCLAPNCPNPAVYRGRCQTHARAHDRAISRAGYRFYRTKAWRVTRDRHLHDHPLCEVCGRVATDVHHRTDLDHGGAPRATENLQSLCHADHSRITRQRQNA